MSGLRCALVTRRFWPLLGDSEHMLGELADEFNSRGTPTTIVTARWHKTWPRQFVYRRTPVVRIPKPAGRVWGTLRFMLSLSRWLRDHRDEIDLVYVASLRSDAHAVLGALSATKIPVVLHCDGATAGDDCRWQQTARFGRRIAARCKTADAVVATTSLAVEQLLAAGYESSRVHHIAGGVPAHRLQTAEMRRQARAVFAESHPVLAVADHAPLVVYAGPIDNSPGLRDLVSSWSAVAERWPNARLWLVGDFAKAGALWERIESLGLKESIILPGVFDFCDELLAAADLFVVPHAEAAASLPMLTAMASGIPVIAASTTTDRGTISEGPRGLLVSVADGEVWTRAMMQVLTDRQLSSRLSASARQYVLREHCLERMADQHLALFHELLASKSVAAE